MLLAALVLAAVPPLSLPANRITLDNGLTVIVSPDHKVPGVAVDLWYQVGSGDEQPGRTGFAHLFEHLMFMGARYAPYPKFDTIMEAHGGSNNASTGQDGTHYYEVGPSNLLETFLWLEADRMQTLGQEMTQDKLETQRKVVLNERRQSYENRPYGEADLLLDQHLFPPGHPYHHPVIGSVQDVQAATLQDVKDFFARWYVPANATLAIVGDVAPEQAVALARKYFAWMPAKPKPPEPTPPPVTLRENDRVDLDDNVELPKVILAWPSPKDGSEGDAAADLLSKVLGDGKASRLYEKLVHQEGIATDVGAAQESQRVQSTFTIEVMGKPNVSPDALIAGVDAAIQALFAKGVTQQELDAARADLYTSVARELEGLVARGEILNHLQIRDHNPAGLQQDLARYDRLTPESFLQQVKPFLAKPRVALVVHPRTQAGTSTVPGATP